ncbi:hypothetical protein B2J88_49620 [Rhodococcus sp. SRB_17]|nr:hypothetical protein [Rhodococcus sp. SRB_17]
MRRHQYRSARAHISDARLTDLTDKDEVQAMINSVPEPHLEPYEVSTAVNSPRNNNPSLLDPV